MRLKENVFLESHFNKSSKYLTNTFHRWYIIHKIECLYTVQSHIITEKDEVG